MGVLDASQTNGAALNRARRVTLTGPQKLLQGM